MKKTFKIGEYCVGGIIQVIISEDKNLVRIRNATMESETIEIRQFRWALDFYALEEFLFELTSLYYAGIVMDWIRKNGSSNWNSYAIKGSYKIGATI